MASAYAEEIGAMYLETSAKDDLNVQDIFVKLSKCLSCELLELHFIVFSGYKLPVQQQNDVNVIKATNSNLRNQRQSSAKPPTCC